MNVKSLLWALSAVTEEWDLGVWMVRWTMPEWQCVWQSLLHGCWPRRLHVYVGKSKYDQAPRKDLQTSFCLLECRPYLVLLTNLQQGVVEILSPFYPCWHQRHPVRTRDILLEAFSLWSVVLKLTALWANACSSCTMLCKIFTTFLHWNKTRNSFKSLLWTKDLLVCSYPLSPYSH